MGVWKAFDKIQYPLLVFCQDASFSGHRVSLPEGLKCKTPWASLSTPGTERAHRRSGVRWFVVGILASPWSPWIPLTHLLPPNSILGDAWSLEKTGLSGRCHRRTPQPSLPPSLWGRWHASPRPCSPKAAASWSSPAPAVPVAAQVWGSSCLQELMLPRWTCLSVLGSCRVPKAQDLEPGDLPNRTLSWHCRAGAAASNSCADAEAALGGHPGSHLPMLPRSVLALAADFSPSSVHTCPSMLSTAAPVLSWVCPMGSSITVSTQGTVPNSGLCIWTSGLLPILKNCEDFGENLIQKGKIWPHGAPLPGRQQRSRHSKQLSLFSHLSLHCSHTSEFDTIPWVLEGQIRVSSPCWLLLNRWPHPDPPLWALLRNNPRPNGHPSLVSQINTLDVKLDFRTSSPNNTRNKKTHQPDLEKCVRHTVANTVWFYSYKAHETIKLTDGK